MTALAGVPDPHLPEWRWRRHAGQLQFWPGELVGRWHYADAEQLVAWESFELLVLWISLGYQP